MHLHVESLGTADGKPQRGSSEAAFTSARWDRRETEDAWWAERVSTLFLINSVIVLYLIFVCNIYFETFNAFAFDWYYSKLMNWIKK